MAVELQDIVEIIQSQFDTVLATLKASSDEDVKKEVSKVTDDNALVDFEHRFNPPDDVGRYNFMMSDGMAGWGDGSDFMGAGGFRVTGFLDKILLIGTIANMILGNIGVNYMPWWNAESGSKVAEPELTVKFELFNDNIYKALINFIFVNTLVPSNKWLQYNIF